MFASFYKLSQFFFAFFLFYVSSKLFQFQNKTSYLINKMHAYDSLDRLVIIRLFPKINVKYMIYVKHFYDGLLLLAHPHSNHISSKVDAVNGTHTFIGSTLLCRLLWLSI